MNVKSIPRDTENPSGIRHKIQKKSPEVRAYKTPMTVADTPIQHWFCQKSITKSIMIPPACYSITTWTCCAFPHCIKCSQFAGDPRQMARNINHQRPIQMVISSRI